MMDNMGLGALPFDEKIIKNLPLTKSQHIDNISQLNNQDDLNYKNTNSNDISITINKDIDNYRKNKLKEKIKQEKNTSSNDIKDNKQLDIIEEKEKKLSEFKSQKERLALQRAQASTEVQKQKEEVLQQIDKLSRQKREIEPDMIKELFPGDVELYKNVVEMKKKQKEIEDNIFRKMDNYDKKNKSMATTFYRKNDKDKDDNNMNKSMDEKIKKEKKEKEIQNTNNNLKIKDLNATEDNINKKESNDI